MTKSSGNGYSTNARQKIWSLLLDQAMTIKQLSEAIGVSAQRVSEILKQIEMKYVDRWVPSKGPYMPAYRIGTQEDAPKPAPKTNAEKSKKYRTSEHGKKVCKKCRIRWRRSKSGLDYDRKRKAGKTARERYQEKGVAGIDPLMAILYR